MQLTVLPLFVLSEAKCINNLVIPALDLQPLVEVLFQLNLELGTSSEA